MYVSLYLGMKEINVASANWSIMYLRDDFEFCTKSFSKDSLLTMLKVSLHSLQYFGTCLHYKLRKDVFTLNEIPAKLSNRAHSSLVHK